MKFLNKRLIAIIHDAFMSGLALFMAIVARYGIDYLPPSQTIAAWIAIFVVISAIVFKFMGLGRGLWRFASLADLRAIVIASLASIVIFVLCLFLVTRLEALPRSVPVITWFIMVVLIGAPRLAYRAHKDGGLGRLGGIGKPAEGIKHVLLAGHVRDAEQAIRTHHLERSGLYKVHALVCPNASKSGHSIRGIPILGNVNELADLAKRLERSGAAVEAILSVTPRPPADFTKSLTQSAAELGIPVKRATPRPLDLSEPDFSELTIDDLLGRPPVKLDTSRMSDLINGRTILVTGAGGSIGSEVVRQILKYNPSRLVLIENSEFALYKIDQEVERRAPGLHRRAVIADVRDRARIHEVVQFEQPAIIFHAAALKHVPLVEDNPLEAIQTNLIGTRNVADAAVAAGAEGFVLISSDKAVKPTSIMGATKRAAEAYCQALDVSGTDTRFITVRFGNVLGSNGSVIPLFRQQIEAGGPVTITHPDMRRYFMTIPEASELVLQAAAFSVDNSNQRGRIYVLDMGDPVKITDLAKILISLAGLRPEKDIELSFTGLRPGEKMFEELFESDEENLPSGADGVIVATANLMELERIGHLVTDLQASTASGNVPLSIAHLSEIVPTLTNEKLEKKQA
ncbi:nucleoside-diphosphate sugar epimerase/dehydratase [Labrenzia sp. PHM005]|uniref:nucleoside-diphosphate sugar epimerase/dehydratase n=1 Tax=Labrenzia sp. PHM005 TaxID=2590016 RepID=UPI0011401293|nr:nucleoside-diphosphate sugar epimerase/dehydratase [Labrenzia sp. PHM005]QDG74927.1 polysaccharide biosynthesis protein [Labrenzia sp. PHM005]